jgi:hypothetical protein
MSNKTTSVGCLDVADKLGSVLPQSDPGQTALPPLVHECETHINSGDTILNCLSLSGRVYQV